MNTFTQKELLEGGFWDGFVKPLAKGAAFVGKHALPKTAAAIKSTRDYGKGLKDSMASKETTVNKKLKEMGYQMEKGSLKPHPNAKGYYTVAASSLTDVDQNGVPVPGRRIVFLVDKDNKIIYPQRRGVTPQTTTTTTPSLSSGTP